MSFEDKLNKDIDKVFEHPESFKVTDGKELTRGFWLDVRKVKPDMVDGMLSIMLSNGESNKIAV